MVFILIFVEFFSFFNLDGSSSNLPTIFTSLAGTGFSSIDAGVGPKKIASALPGGQ